jgi:hypothetical protein
VEVGREGDGSLAGSGVGLYGAAGGGAVAEVLGMGGGDASTAPPAPEVAVSAPGSGGSDGGDASDRGPDDSGDDDTDDPPTTTVTTTPDASGTTPTATTDGAGTTRESTSDEPLRGGGGFGGGGAPPVNASVALDVTDPAPIRSDDGTVGAVSGTPGGELSWTGRVTDAVFVVQTWVPGDGWREVTRVTVAASSPVSVADALGEIEYADAARAAGFANDDPGTVRRTGGKVSVTAVLFDGEAEVARVEASEPFTVTVENTGRGALELDMGNGTNDTRERQLLGFGSGSSGGSGGSAGNDSDAGAGAGSGTVVPGQAGVNRVPLTNRGSTPGTLTLSSITYVSYENGRTAPERKVDPTGGDPGPGAGELDGAVEIRARAVTDGTRTYVIGNETTFRSIRSLRNGSVDIAALDPGESTDLVVEFRVPESAGNEIQGDTIVVDFGFSLTGTG